MGLPNIKENYDKTKINKSVFLYKHKCESKITVTISTNESVSAEK